MIGFDLSLRHESGRLSIGAMEHVPMVQLSGEGLLGARDQQGAVRGGGQRRAPRRAAGRDGRGLGRSDLCRRPRSPGDLAAAQAGLVHMNGDGAVFVDAL